MLRPDGSPQQAQSWNFAYDHQARQFHVGGAMVQLANFDPRDPCATAEWTGTEAASPVVINRYGDIYASSDLSGVDDAALQQAYAVMREVYQACYSRAVVLQQSHGHNGIGVERSQSGLDFWVPEFAHLQTVGERSGLLRYVTQRAHIRPQKLALYAGIGSVAYMLQTTQPRAVATVG